MKQILSAGQMSSVDTYNIEEMGMPSLVLMERAALSCVEIIENLIHQNKYTSNSVGVICGIGNNGGDGVAIARILHNKGIKSSYIIIGNKEKCSYQLNEEIKIASRYGVNRCELLSEMDSCDILVDALFGIGLSREVTGVYKDAISYINNSNKAVLSVDIPSGYNSDNGSVMGTGVKADYTVTFAYIKKGLLLNECYLNRGDLTVADVGIYINSTNSDSVLDNSAHMCYLLEKSDINKYIPATKASDNKGTRGNVLVIAGSENIYGACYLSAKAALCSGSGLVKIYTHENNIQTIQASLPEAMYDSYSSFDMKKLDELLSRAKSLLIGPGLGTSETSEKILEYVIKNANCPIVIDADGINILAKSKELLICANSTIVLTPHLKEMSRLCNDTVENILHDMEKYAVDFGKEYNVNIILKNFTSFIYTNANNYINITGNEGMATAGSGDVLAGILVSLIGQGVPFDIAPALASLIHGQAGERASLKKGIRQMTASDIIDYLEF